MAGQGLSGKWCPHQRKGGSSWRRRSPKEEEARRPLLLCAGGWGWWVSPANPGDNQKVSPTCSASSACCPPPHPAPRLIGGHWVGVSPSSSVRWPVPAITGPRIPEKVVPLRRIPGPSFDHRKWWLGEGRWPESSQESRGLLLCSRAAIAF